MQNFMGAMRRLMAARSSLLSLTSQVRKEWGWRVREGVGGERERIKGREG